MGQVICFKLGGSLTEAKCNGLVEYRSLMPPHDGAAAFTLLSFPAAQLISHPLNVHKHLVFQSLHGLSLEESKSSLAAKAMRNHELFRGDSKVKTPLFDGIEGNHLFHNGSEHDMHPKPPIGCNFIL